MTLNYPGDTKGTKILLDSHTRDSDQSGHPHSLIRVGRSFGYPLKAHSEDSDQADYCVGLTSYYVFSTCFSQIITDSG